MTWSLTNAWLNRFCYAGPAVTFTACALFGSGCGSLRAHVDASFEQPEAPAAFYRASLNYTGVVTGRWWRAMGEPALNQLMDQALSANPGLLAAAWRLTQAQASAVKAGASRLPQLDAEAVASRRHTENSAGSGASAAAAKTDVDSFSLGLAAAYEVDLWGRLAALHQAACEEVTASCDDLESAAVSLTAELAETWFQAREQRVQLTLLSNQVAVSRRFLDLTELRYRHGQSSAVEVLQQRQQVASLCALIPRARSSYETLRHGLAVLSGQWPGKVAVVRDDDFQPLPPMPDTGVPADLLLQRPDLRAALTRLEAQDRRLAAAVAERLPSLRLSASTGALSQELSELLDGWFWNLAGNLAAPLFDGRRRAAEADRTRAVLREQSVKCKQALLQAVREVEDALVRERELDRVLAEKTQQLEWSVMLLDQERRRYRLGLTDYLPVLLALNSQQALERDYVTAQRQRISARIQLYRALGGGATLTQALRAVYVDPFDPSDPSAPRDANFFTQVVR